MRWQSTLPPVSVAEAPGGHAAADSGARWSDVQRRVDDLAQTLYQIREAASDDGDRARAECTLASLQALRSAMEAERSTGGTGAEQATVVRSRLAMFESSLQALRNRSDDMYREPSRWLTPWLLSPDPERVMRPLAGLARMKAS